VPITRVGVVASLGVGETFGAGRGVAVGLGVAVSGTGVEGGVDVGAEVTVAVNGCGETVAGTADRQATSPITSAKIPRNLIE